MPSKKVTKLYQTVHLFRKYMFLTHSTLIGIPRTLVVMWIRNKPCTNSQQSKRFNFQVSCGPCTVIQKFRTPFGNC